MAHQPRKTNRLLALLADEDRRSIEADLVPVWYPQLKQLYGPDDAIDGIDFPLSCIVSLVVSAGENESIQITSVGNEGATGVYALLDGPKPIGRNVVHLAGEALRLNLRRFERHAEQNERFRRLMCWYLSAFTRHMAQESACNLLHTTEERCARWLLMTQDRLDRDSFPLTQELLAQMMAVRRATINLAVRMLRSAGLVRYERGQIAIADRKGLEELACPCYHLIRDEYAALRRP